MTTQRASCWSVTINNPTKEDEESIARSRQSGWKVEGQLEKGDSGTLHYQLSVKTPQVRFSALKKAFPRAHIEIARNAVALDKYCGKAESRVAALAVSQEMYPSQAKYFELLWEVILADPTASEYRRPGELKRFANSTHALVKATGVLIRKGYYVENIAANPMTMHSWNLYHDAFLHRWTTRQTDEATVEVPEINLLSLGIQDASQNDDQEGLHPQGEADAVSAPGAPSPNCSSSANIHRDDCSSGED